MPQRAHPRPCSATARVRCFSPCAPPQPHRHHAQPAADFLLGPGDERTVPGAVELVVCNLLHRGEEGQQRVVFAQRLNRPAASGSFSAWSSRTHLEAPQRLVVVDAWQQLAAAAGARDLLGDPHAVAQHQHLQQGGGGGGCTCCGAGACRERSQGQQAQRSTRVPLS